MTKDRVMLYVAVATGTSTVLISMALNVWAFSEQLPGMFAVLMGVCLPVWVLALTFAGEWACAKPATKLMGMGAYILAGFLLLVSLPHLAYGFDKITGGRWWESWSLAIVADATQVAMKMAVIALAKSGKMQAKPVEARKKPSKKPSKPALLEMEAV